MQGGQGGNILTLLESILRVIKVKFLLQHGTPNRNLILHLYLTLEH